MHLALDLLYLIGFLFASPWLAYRYLTQRSADKVARGRLPATLPEGAIWLHGSSVGEVSLIRPLVALLEQRRPELPIVVSSHTATGVESARKAYPKHTVFRFPVDLSFVQRKLMRRLKPAAVVVVESDLWPNHLLAAARDAVPVAIVNGKLSERSFRLHRISGFVPRALTRVALVAAQTAEHAERFAGLGVARDRIEVTGNMKYDLTADDADPEHRRELRAQLGFAESDVVVIGGSLHPGEDQDLLAAFASTAPVATPTAPAATAGAGRRTRLIIVPRYPEQAATVIENATAAGFVAIAKSVLAREPDRAGDAECVIVVDTVGELRRLYAAADIAFVGGSLYFRGANKGGHNLMEPAILGLPVIFGPHNFSFRETVSDLLAADAGIEVRDRAELGTALAGLVSSAERRAEMGNRARQVVLQNQGASVRNCDLLLTIFDNAAGCRRNPQDAQCRDQTQSHLLNE